MTRRWYTLPVLTTGIYRLPDFGGLPVAACVVGRMSATHCLVMVLADAATHTALALRGPDHGAEQRNPRGTPALLDAVRTEARRLGAPADWHAHGFDVGGG